MGIRQFASDDKPFLNWVKQNPNGFVINTASGDKTSYLVFHKSECRHITKYTNAQQDGAFTERNYIKVCSNNPSDLLTWAESNRTEATNHKVCKKCSPEINSTSATPSLGKNIQISFDDLRTSQTYERKFLAELWGYKSFHAISRGVVTPTKTNQIILFVTKIKQEAQTQYNDYIDGKILYWEGESKHSSDSRIINASKEGDKVHLFYRDIHHSPFTYYGEIYTKEHSIRTDRPSQFSFTIGKNGSTPDVIDDLDHHKKEYESLDETERDSVVKSRIGQGTFRKRLIDLWGCCSVTGLKNIPLLRASHIKPWRDCSNLERLDPMNGLLLHPTLDHLFDSGFISFDDNGKILVSDKISNADLEILHISRNDNLRKAPKGLAEYLGFHRDNVFDQD